MLQQALEFFDDSPQKILACDAQIERQCAAMKPRCVPDEPPAPLPRAKPGSKSKNKPN